MRGFVQEQRVQPRLIASTVSYLHSGAKGINQHNRHPERAKGNGWKARVVSSCKWRELSERGKDTITAT